MTPDEARWVRENVAAEPRWGHPARWGACDLPAGPCTPCWDRITPATHDCEHGKPLPEAYLSVRRGAGYSSLSVPVWLADRVCRRACSCGCRGDVWAIPETGDGAVQPSLFAEVA